MEYVPNEITGFTSTNLVDTYPDYNPATTYTLETGTPTSASICRVGAYYYRSVVNGNIGNNPLDFEGIKWVKYGISNKWAMLDLSALSKSTYAGDMVVEFDQGLIQTIGIGYYEASSVLIEVLLDTTVVYSYETELTINTEVIDWWSYLYEPYNTIFDRSIKIDIPMIADTIRITWKKFTDSTLTACGFLVGGQSVDMGCTLNNVKFRFNSYAKKTYDDFGSLSIVKRSVQDLVDFETIVSAGESIAMKREIKKIYNDIVMFVVDNSDSSIHENMVTLGTVQDCSIVISDKDKTILTWSIIEAI